MCVKFSGQRRRMLYKTVDLSQPKELGSIWSHWSMCHKTSAFSSIKCGVQNLTTGGDPLWNYFGSPTQWVWDLILLWFCPSSYCLTEASLSLGYLFLMSSSILLLMAVQQLVAILLLSQEEMTTYPSTWPSWTRSLLFLFYWLTYLFKMHSMLVFYMHILFTSYHNKFG